MLSRQTDASGLVVATLAGVVTSGDQVEVIDFVRASIATIGDVRVLLRLEMFVGWNHVSRLDPASLWLRDDEGVTRMAIVGAPEWRVPVLTMMAQPIRRLPIRYFVSETAARQWLNGGPAASPPATV